MNYTFEILGISPILEFFTHQQQLLAADIRKGVEYISSYRCTLDSFLISVEQVAPQRGWDPDQLVQSVVHFWMQNPEGVELWKRRLGDAGLESLVIARIGNLPALRQEFERLWQV